MNQLFFQLKRQHRLGRPHMLWYYHDEKDRVVSRGFLTREAAYRWIENNVPPNNRRYYEYEDPLVRWYKQGVTELDRC